MKKPGLFTIQEFANFSRTTRDTLLYYDKIGLLSPVSYGENNYRFYSKDQLAVMNVIRTLQDLGLTLNEIKNLKDRRTPSLADEVFSQYIEKIDAKIDEWVQSRKLLTYLHNTIQSVANVDENNITVQVLPEESIILGDINDYSNGRNDYDTLLSFYHTMEKKHPHLNPNYPVWAVFSKERIKNGNWVWPNYYYFSNPEGQDKKPAGLYAIGYQRGGYGQCNKAFERLTEYINKNGLEINGDAYEEYPLNEISVIEDKDYLMRVMIIVKKKE